VFPLTFPRLKRRQAVEISRRSPAYLQASPVKFDINGEPKTLSPLLTSLVFYGAPPRPVPLDFAQGIEQAADGQSSPAHGSLSSRLPSTYLEAPENLSKPIAFTASARTSSTSPLPRKHAGASPEIDTWPHRRRPRRNPSQPGETLSQICSCSFDLDLRDQNRSLTRRGIFRSGAFIFLKILRLRSRSRRRGILQSEAATCWPLI
jgi:hypothetical protein